MKRVMMFALLAAFVLGSVSMASAQVEVKADGYFKANATWTDNFDFQSAEDADDNGSAEESEDDFFIKQRARINFSFAANENVLGFVRAQATWKWGTEAVGESVSDTGFDIVRAYLQFNLPNTDAVVTAGRQGIAFANSGMGSPILDDDVDALLITSPINDMIGIAAAYGRLADDGIDSKAHDEFDILYAAVPVTLEGVSVTPYFAYGMLGKDVAFDFGNGANTLEDDATAWWAGAALNLNVLDPFVVNADLIYGKLATDQDENSMSGWWADLAVAYTGLDFMTPKLFVVYSTGDDEDDYADDGSGRMPIFTVGSEGFVGPGMDTMAFDDDTFLDGDNEKDAPGFMAIGFALTDITFVEKLSHDFMIAYIRGTNDSDLIGNGYAAGKAGQEGYLTDGDSIIEVDFNTQYQIYEELAAIVNLGYQKVDLDDDWEDLGVDEYSDAWRVGFGLKYSF